MSVNVCESTYNTTAIWQCLLAALACRPFDGRITLTLHVVFVHLLQPSKCSVRSPSPFLHQHKHLANASQKAEIVNCKRCELLLPLLSLSIDMNIAGRIQLTARELAQSGAHEYIKSESRISGVTGGEAAAARAQRQILCANFRACVMLYYLRCATLESQQIFFILSIECRRRRRRKNRLSFANSIQNRSVTM